MDKEDNQVDYHYYAVAFIDILGQSEAFKDHGIYIDSVKHPLAGKHEEKIKRLAEAHRKTAKVIKELRNKFCEYAEMAASENSVPDSIPSEHSEQYRQMIKVNLKLHMFSDCMLVSTCLAGLSEKKHYGSVLTSLRHIFTTCEGMILEALAMKKPFRGAIDVGMGTRMDLGSGIENGEIYGAISSRVFELEHNVAQYPRMVIGDDLIQFLRTVIAFPGGVNDWDSNYCKASAQDCLKRIKQDLDGIYILDYLGQATREELLKVSKEDVLNEAYDAAFEFIDSEYKKYQKSRDQKLAQRYFMLRQYFIDSKG